nr:MAG TPA: hypothetical protein [Bacteriophage sp.]
MACPCILNDNIPLSLFSSVFVVKNDGNVISVK